MKRWFNALLILGLAMGVACQTTQSASVAARPDGPAVREGFFTSDDGVKLHYREFGSGSQVVLVPLGTYLSGKLSPLAKGRRVIFYDPRGRGKSDTLAADKRSTIEREIQDLELIRRELKAGKVSLIGWSAYGLVVAKYALAHPDRVDRIVQLSPTPLKRSPHLESIFADIMLRIDADVFLATEQQNQEGAFKNKQPEYCRKRFEAFHGAYFWKLEKAKAFPSDFCELPNEWPANVEKANAALLGPLGDWNFTEEVRTIIVPRLVILADKDFLPAVSAKEWVGEQPNAKMWTVKDSGHWSFAEQTQSVIAAIETFLSGGWPE